MAARVGCSFEELLGDACVCVCLRHLLDSSVENPG